MYTDISKFSLTSDNFCLLLFNMEIVMIIQVIPPRKCNKKSGRFLLKTPDFLDWAFQKINS